MKQLILIVLILIQILMFTGCTDETDTTKFNSIEGNDRPVQQNTIDIAEDDNLSTGKTESDAQAAIDSSPFVIIAEPGNSILSVDKEKVIKKLEDELDTLFNSINNLEDN